MAAIFHFFFMPMLKIHPLPIKKYFYLHMSKKLCNFAAAKVLRDRDAAAKVLRTEK